MVKLLCMLFYRFKLNWLSDEHFEQFPHVRLIVFLNHTSLFEPVYIGVAPLPVLWRLSGELLAPGADITLNDRPIVGRIYHSLLPGMIPISRKKDDTWQYFMNQIGQNTLVAIAPEGRMKRRNGLDKFGQPMSIRGGVADILSAQKSGKMIFVYSGGLHHVHAPGDKWPRLFKKIDVNAEIIDINDYKKDLEYDRGESFRKAVIEDMEWRLQKKVPNPKF